VVSMNEVDAGTVDNTGVLAMTQEDRACENIVQHHAKVLVCTCRETNPSKSFILNLCTLGSPFLVSNCATNM